MSERWVQVREERVVNYSPTYGQVVLVTPVDGYCGMWVARDAIRAAWFAIVGMMEVGRG